MFTIAQTYPHLTSQVWGVRCQFSLQAVTGTVTWPVLPITWQSIFAKLLYFTKFQYLLLVYMTFFIMGDWAIIQEEEWMIQNIIKAILKDMKWFIEMILYLHNCPEFCQPINSNHWQLQKSSSLNWEIFTTFNKNNHKK